MPQDRTRDEAGAGARRPAIPKPPTAQEIDQISRDQEMISDEWGDVGPGREPPVGPRAPGAPDR